MKMKSVTVEPILFFYIMVIFLENNAIQELISIKSCLKILNPVNISDCFEKNKTNFTDSIEKEKTFWIRFNGASMFLFTFLSGFFVASWSDKFGRKFPMLIPPIGTTIAAVINCYFSSFIYTHIAYHLIGSIISGLTFGSLGIIATTFGFITDISDESSRTKRMMILEAMIFIGGTIGIYIAGEFLDHHDYNLNFNSFSRLFIFEMSVAVLIIIYIIFRIPNRNNLSEVSQISCRKLFKLNHVKDAMKTVFRPRDAGKRKNILLLSLTLFLIYFGLIAQFTVAYYFVQKKLNWNFQKYSLYNSLQFAVEGITLLVGMVFFHFLKVSDHFLALIGILSKMIAYTVFGLSNNDAILYTCIIWYMFAEYPVPAIRSILSKTVEVDEKGRIFAFTTMVQNFSFLVGSLVLPTVYESTITFFPGLCFELVASFQVFAACIIIYLCITKTDDTSYKAMENEDGPAEVTNSVRSITGSINQ